MFRQIKKEIRSEIDLLYSEWRYAKRQMDNIEKRSLRKED